MSSGSTPFIAIAEDNPADVLLVREVLKDSPLWHELHVAEDGAVALQFLKRSGAIIGKPRPDLILLDLNLPKRDGREVLQEVKADPSLRAIPTIILTTSDDESDVCRAYSLHANCYITKPIDFDEFAQKLRSVEDFWLRSVRFCRAAARAHA